MNLCAKFNAYIKKLAVTKDKSELETMFADDMYHMHVKMGWVILVFESTMILLTLLRGGSFSSIRGKIYFYLYLLLFCVTGLFLISLVCFRKYKSQHISWQMNLSSSFAGFLCLWGCAITLLDQHSGSNLNVYCYLLMATAVFCFLKPWQSLLLYTSVFLLFNCFAAILQDNPIFFGAPLNANNLIINSSFITILTIIISIMLYRYRVMKKHDTLLIQKQYEQIQNINHKLNTLAMTDQLTGIGNRRYLEEQMQNMLESPSSYQQVAGILLDIDFFKQYNDNYGHQKGDSCLKEISAIMHKFSEKEHGFLVRYGGEEFFLCIPDCDNALEKAEELRKEIILQHLVRDDMEIGCVTVSIGVDVETDLLPIGQDGFLRRCDKALYEAKNTGRNKVCIYSSNS